MKEKDMSEMNMMTSMTDHPGNIITPHVRAIFLYSVILNLPFAKQIYALCPEKKNLHLNK